MGLPRLHLWVALAIVSAVSMGEVSRAQTARSGGGANTQLLMQVQELASERTSLQAENARLTKELQAAQKERDALKAGQKALDARARTSAAQLAETTAQRESTEQKLKRANEQMQELVARFRETIKTLHDIESDRAATKQALGTRDRELKVCVDRNLAMYKVTEETLARLDKESIWSRITEKEPFTRIKRVQLENLIDDYRARAQDERVTPGSLKAGAATIAPPGAPATSAPSSSAAPPRAPH